MPDETNVPGQPDSPGQPTAAPAGTAPAENWEARYKGSVALVEKLTLEKRGLEQQLAAKTSEAEQLRVQLGQKDAEGQIAVKERDAHLQQQLTKVLELEKELGDLRALKLKVETARKLDRPDLVALADTLPNLTDAAALEAVMKQIAEYADAQVKSRERELMAGITHAATVGAAPAAPSSAKGWVERINALPLGSPERMKAMDEYGDWLERQNRKP